MTSTTTKPAPWWRTANNPPCPDWCQSDHPEDEFAQGGGMLCAGEVAGNDGFSVEVQQCTLTDLEGTPDVYVTDPMNIWTWVSASEEMSPEAAEEFAQGLLLAVEFIRSHP